MPLKIDGEIKNMFKYDTQMGEDTHLIPETQQMLFVLCANSFPTVSCLLMLTPISPAHSLFLQ